MTDDLELMGPSDHWRHRLALASDQTGDAELQLARQAGDVLRWPWPDLDILTGPVGMGGEIWFLVAPSGTGKTTFVLSLIELLRQCGKRVYVMPLETSARSFRASLACMTLSHHPDAARRMVLNPGDINSGHWLTFPDVEAIRTRLRRAYEAQREEPYVNQVMVRGDGSLDVPRMVRAFKEAASFGADLVIVDHIDHIKGTGGHVSAQSIDICHTALEVAKAYDLRVLFTSQISFNMIRTPDKMAKYQPALIHHLKYPTTKVEVATGIISLSRAIRPPMEGEDGKAYKAALAAASNGQAEPQSVLVPGVTQVNATKLRNYGERDGQHALLRYDHGRLLAMMEKDRYQTVLGGRMLRAV